MIIITENIALVYNDSHSSGGGGGGWNVVVVMGSSDSDSSELEDDSDGSLTSLKDGASKLNSVPQDDVLDDEESSESQLVPSSIDDRVGGHACGVSYVVCVKDANS